VSSHQATVIVIAHDNGFLPSRGVRREYSLLRGNRKESVVVVGGENSAGRVRVSRSRKPAHYNKQNNPLNLRSRSAGTLQQEEEQTIVYSLG
jgi:hypothetical protein